MNSTPRDYHVDSVQLDDIQQTRFQQPVGTGINTTQKTTTVYNDHSESDAYEKGRMAGEMEALRRMEAEGRTGLNQGMNQAAMNSPDVVEINHLTWAQRIAAVLSEGTSIAYVIMVGVFLDMYRGDVDTVDEGGFRPGLYNTHILTGFLGLFCVTQAYMMYRILPVRTRASVNRAIYIFWQCAAATCFGISLWAGIRSAGEEDTKFFSGFSWVAMFALVMWLLHAVYSIIRTCIDSVLPVDYHTWNETPRNDHTAPAGTRKGGFLSRLFRRHGPTDTQPGAIYTPAPRAVPLASGASHNVGAQVPAAPGNAPRWAENPNTHANDYWLLPRAKWATVNFALLATSCIVAICMWQAILINHNSYATAGQVPDGQGGIDQDSGESYFMSAIALVTAIAMAATLYVIIPPRTTLVKNGILNESQRRASMSHQAPTRLGGNDEWTHEQRMVETV